MLAEPLTGGGENRSMMRDCSTTTSSTTRLCASASGIPAAIVSNAAVSSAAASGANSRLIRLRIAERRSVPGPSAVATPIVSQRKDTRLPALHHPPLCPRPRVADGGRGAVLGHGDGLAGGHARVPPRRRRELQPETLRQRLG